MQQTATNGNVTEQHVLVTCIVTSQTYIEIAEYHSKT